MGKYTGKLKMINKIGYSFYQIAGVINVLISAWQMYFYTSFCNISIVMVTLMLTVSKVIGAVATPVIGYISDNLYKTKFGKKFGRRKGLLLIGIPLKTLTFPLYWIPKMPLAYYFIVIILLSFVDPLLTVSQGTFAAEMTENSSQRAQLAGFNQVGGAVAGIIGSMFTVYLFNIFGENNASTYFIAAIIYDMFALIMFIIFYLSVFERPVDESTVKVRKKPSLKDGIVGIAINFISAIRLKSYRLYLGMYLSEQMFRSLSGTINTYFIVFVLALNPKSVSVSTSVGFVFGIMFLMFFMWLTAKTNGPFTYRIGAYATILILILFLYLGIVKPAHLVIIQVILTIALNFGKTGLVNSAQFMFTFMPDLDEVVTGRRREGAYSGVNSFLDVIFSTLESLIVGVLLQMTGFAKGAKVQPPTTVHALLILYTIVPIILVVLGIFISFKFELTVQNHKILLTEVERLREGGSKSEAPEEAKELIKELTGFDYEQCWGNNKLIDYGENHIIENKTLNS